MAPQEQHLVEWTPHSALGGECRSFADIAIHSPEHQKLLVVLLCEEGELRIEFKDVRAFLTFWDGDPNPLLTFKETASRPANLFRIEGSCWLASDLFYLDCESSFSASEEEWRHFCIIANERSIHIAARDQVEATLLMT